MKISILFRVNQRKKAPYLDKVIVSTRSGRSLRSHAVHNRTDGEVMGKSGC